MIQIYGCETVKLTRKYSISLRPISKPVSTRRYACNQNTKGEL